MKSGLWITAFLVACSASATVISPSSMEVGFSYESEFQTSKDKKVSDLIEDQSSYLFGYMQNPEIVGQWNLGKRIEGIGAPYWLPKLTVLSTSEEDGVTTIRYRAEGRLLLMKDVAKKLIADGRWDITLPYDLDHFYDKSCGDKDFPEKSDFWYFGDPFRKGCERLREPNLAQPVTVSIKTIPGVPDDLPANLDELRVANGHDVFQVTAINGFADSSTQKNDDGRKNYETMNKWFVDQGFTDTPIQRYKNRPIHQFDKYFKRKDGRIIHVRLTRLLAETTLDGNHDVTFSKFFEKQIQDSDVIIYEGHSGLGANLQFSDLEKRAGIPKTQIDPDKRQLFFFDSCSSYSYYLGMFDGVKAPGKVNVLTNGVESLFGYEVPETKHLYNILFDFDNNDYTWNEIISEMEIPFRGATFMMNVYINDPESQGMMAYEK